MFWMNFRVSNMIRLGGLFCERIGVIRCKIAAHTAVTIAEDDPRPVMRASEIGMPSGLNLGRLVFSRV